MIWCLKLIKEAAKHNKILVTTLTKHMAEDLIRLPMKSLGIRVKYLHADIDTLERQKELYVICEWITL